MRSIRDVAAGQQVDERAGARELRRLERRPRVPLFELERDRVAVDAFAGGGELLLEEIGRDEPRSDGLDHLER